MLETVTISGLGTYLPSRVLRNDDLKELFDTSDQWISQRTGIRERRIAEPGMASSDLGVPAARAALADAGLGAEEVDMIVTATISPDQLMPATASRIAHALGAVNSGAMDLSAGCTGFVYALATAMGMVSAGICGNVLVVGAETISRILDLSLIHISEPTRRTPISYAVFCLKKKKTKIGRHPDGHSIRPTQEPRHQLHRNQ